MTKMYVILPNSLSKAFYGKKMPRRLPRHYNLVKKGLLRNFFSRSPVLGLVFSFHSG